MMRIFERTTAVLGICLAAFAVSGSRCSTDASSIPGVCGKHKSVHLQKVLTPTDRDLVLATPDSALLTEDCKVYFVLKFKYNNPALQATVGHDTLNPPYPLTGLNPRTLFTVNGLAFRNSTIISTELNQKVYDDYIASCEDHGSYSGEPPSGLGIYKISTSLLPSVQRLDSSVWVDATLNYYDGSN